MQSRVRAKYKAQPPKVMLLACDTDADWIGASLMKALRLKNPDAEFCGTGGRLMAQQGLLDGCAKGTKAPEGVFFLWQRRQVIRQLLRQALIERPDVLVVINASSWALSVAKWLRQHSNAKIYFFDADGPHLAKGGLEKLADVTFDTLPHKRQDGHTFVGHPIFEKFAEYIPTGEAKPLSKPLKLALMPSTFNTYKQMQKLSKVVDELRKEWADLEVIIPLEDGHNPRCFEPFAYLAAEYVRGTAKYETLSQCDAALASKDTTNLDLVALGVPVVLLPKYGFLLDKLYSFFMHGQYVSPLKHWGGEHVIPTLESKKNMVQTLVTLVHPLMTQGPARKAQLAALAKMRQSLVADKKTASVTAAAEIFGGK